MADDGYLFSKDLTQRTVNTIKKVSGTVTRASVPPSRSRRGGKTPVVESPFKMSLTKNETSERLVTIDTGRVFIDANSAITQYLIEKNSINIESESVGTLFIYLKVAANWQLNNAFIGYPILTPKTGEDIAQSNFASNSTKYPATDADNYFYSIGTVDITEAEGVKKYKLNQIAFTDSYFKSYTMNAFTVNRIFKGKASDEEVDADYYLWTNDGQAVLPDSNPIIYGSRCIVGVSDIKHVYLEISASQTSNGGWENFTAKIVYEDNEKSNTDDFNYFLIATNNQNSITQGLLGNFNSGGRIQ